MNSEQWGELAKKHFEEPVKAFAREAIAVEAMPILDELKAKILSLEIDPIKNTSLDNMALAAMVDQVKELLAKV